MAFDQIGFTILDDTGDRRGSSFTLPPEVGSVIGPMVDLHLSTLLPEPPHNVRGNHYHLERDEVIFVLASDRWTFCWDRGEDSPHERRHFGRGSVLVQVARGWSHAVVNTGTRELVLVALTSDRYDPTAPDAHRRVVTR